MRTASITHAGKEGFTLVVIAALFLAFSIIAAAAVERSTVVQAITKRADAQAQLSRLSMAIIEYSVFNSTGTYLFYPCPAPINAAASSATFGTAVTNCWNTPASGMTVMPSNTDIVWGMVPVQTLSPYGIGYNDAFDPWGNRILYVVNRRLTLASTTYVGAQSSNVTVTDAAMGLTIPPPDFVLVSLGRDGLGAVKRNSTAVSIACGGSGDIRNENCNGDAIFKVAPANTGTSATSSTYFDDILTYYRQ